MKDNPPVATRRLVVEVSRPDGAAVREAAAVLRRGGTVAFPTETVYGLGANALDPAAVARVFAAKGRPAGDPLIVHLSGSDALPAVARVVPPLAAALAARFWPGPLSLVLPKQPIIPDGVTAGLDTVAVRVPAHPVALALVSAAGVPVAAPSANRFGHTSPTTATHVLDDLDGRIDVVLDGGPTTIGVESTVLDVSGDRPVLLRPGGVTVEQLREVLGDALIIGRAEVSAQAAPSPGLLTTHYAPRAELRLYAGERAAALDAIALALRDVTAAGGRAGLLVSSEDAARLGVARGDVAVVRLGPESDPDAQAQRLFAGMRQLDAAGVTVIFARLPGEAGLGRAIADRLTRAAGGKVLAAGPSGTPGVEHAGG